ncbi:class I adenylate-forming enzyme family protein [Halosegnis marinus]|uniref:Class I adenylate-forming enzyme family protein n=1 Tax=Halosegnis marinus TaxID=3034023 RepID=A0ABD5ZSL4_9EURY|nr:class I adenylate-forming enzyme family protein [Halosegnis sp. DT85]
MRDWLALRAGATPTRTALVDARTGRATTYGALDARVEELAGRLSALGVGVDDHLGVVAGTRPAFLELVHAAARVGAVLVPLNARYTAAELRETAGRADVDALVCEADTEAAAVESFDGPVATLDDPAHGATDLAAVEPATFDVPAWDRDCAQALVATSGTTGGPKLVELTSGNLLASAAASSWRLGVLPADRWYCTLPMYHMGGLAPVYRSVLYGTAVVVGTPGSFDPERALAEMSEHDATGVSVVPTMARDLLDVDDGALADLRFVLVGGAATPDALVERANEAGVPLHPSYGMTEAASQIATARPADTAAALGTVGHPLVFTEVTVTDGEGTVLPPGEPGEIVVSGSTVSPGYYGDEDATDEAFGPHGFHTGDAGYRDTEGRLWVLNRLDDRIVTGGENVDPGEVAGVLRDHPDVEEAFVLGLPDDRYGQRVAALVVGADDTAALESFARERLAGFKLPRTWRVVDALPRTASGTVDRAAARDLFGDT